MFIKIENLYINPENVTHFVVEGELVMVHFVGGESLTLDGDDAKHFLAELGRSGRY